MGNLVVDDGVDEFAEFSIKMNQSKYTSKTFSLTILPTMNCNLDCDYCFEEKQNKRLDDNTANNLIKFVNKHIKNHNPTSMHVSWFGGEPLLELERIISLSDQFLDICNTKNILYSASMTSNCWLLTPEIAKKLVEKKISSIQVTLDGPKLLHDRRRVIKGSRHGTFDKIMRNITECSRFIPLIVRVNLDKHMITLIDDFFQDIKQLQGLKGVSLYPGCISGDATKVCSSIEGNCLDVEDFARVSHEFYTKMIENDFGLSWYPKPAMHVCCATSPFAFVIQPDGFICRCWDQVGQIKESHSNINDEAFFIGENLYKWILYNPTLIQECADCVYFPLCRGGCPARRIPATTNYMGSDTNGRCASYKYNMKEMLLLVYDEYLKKEAAKNEPKVIDEKKE